MVKKERAGTRKQVEKKVEQGKGEDIHQEEALSEGSPPVEEGTVKGGAVESHFWVCSSAFLETMLFIVPGHNTEVGDQERASEILVFDADGEEVNQLRFAPGAGGVGGLALDMILGECKLNLGLRHGHMIVRSPHGSQHFCRIYNRERGALLGELQPLNEDRARFFPLLLAAEYFSYLCFVNYGDKEGVVKCRLFCGTRTPEMELSVPARGVRVLGIEEAFPDFIGQDESARLQAYVRLVTREGSSFGVQLLERVNIGEGSESVSSVC